VERKGESASAIASYDPSNPKLRRADEVSDLFEQVGKYANYILDLEEMLADNFESGSSAGRIFLRLSFW
jgi:hypothetical protein